jgi:hypothetical protein
MSFYRISKESSSEIGNKNKRLLELINEKGEKLKAKPLTPSPMGPDFYEKVGVRGLTEDYQKKYNKVLESGLKTNLQTIDSSYKAMSKIDAAYKRLLAIEESKKTGIPIVVVVDFFNDPFLAHGNQIAKRDIEKKGLIPLSYDDKSLPTSEIINEVIDLKQKGVNIQSLNCSLVQGEELTVTQLTKALEKDGVAQAREIEDDGSNLINYKSLIRDWLLNGKKGVYGPVMPGLEQLKLGTKNQYREAITSFDKLSDNSIYFVNSAGNDGPGTISIYSFVQGGIPVGALNSRGQIANYTSKTSLVRANAVVKEGISIAIYEQVSGNKTRKVRHDYDGDWIYDEELPLVGEEMQKTVSTLDKLKLADKKVVDDLRALFIESRTDEGSNKNFSASLQLLTDYVFKKEDLELIKRENNHNPKVNGLIRTINSAQKQFPGDLVSAAVAAAYFNQILVNPDNGKLQFLHKSPIEGTSFAAPQIAVKKALKNLQVF